MSWIAYPSGAVTRLRPALIALRVIAVMAVCALLLDLVIGTARPPVPLIALDASASWLKGGDSTAWRIAADSARQGGGEVVLFGDSVRSATIPGVPGDLASFVGPAVQRAAGVGQRVLVITDGGIDDADALQQAAAGSRLVVVTSSASSPDRAISDLSAPVEGRAGDSISVVTRITSGSATTAASTVRWLLDDTVLGQAPVPPMTAASEVTIMSTLVVPSGDSLAVLRAVLQAGGDEQPRNDSLAVPFRRGARQRVVVLSTAPDADVRDVTTALRANVALPTDAFFRIAPGRWLRDGNLTPVDESVVRVAVRGASLAVLHGDTTVMGSPSSLGTRALLLLAPPDGDTPELLVRPAPSSPLQAALGGIVIESLPPLLATAPARGGLTALSAAPGITATGAMPVVTVSEGAVRRVLITAAGYSRWRARGGVSEVAFQALIGGATDWLLGARGVAAAPVTVTPVQRAGAPIRWRRGANPEAVLALVRDGDRRARRDTLVFAEGSEVSMPPLDVGVWRGTVDGAPVVLPISASREWLPGSGTLRSGPLNGEAVPIRRGARSLGWLYLATVLLLATEWLLRRRAGLR